MKRVLIPLAQGCEELEAVTLIDILRRAEINVTVAGLDQGPVTCSRDTVITPDTTLDAVQSQSFDLIVLPGGQPGTDNLASDPRIISLLQQQHGSNKLIGAICAAPKVLAQAGLLERRHATGYPGVLDQLKLGSTTITNSKIESDGLIITSRGPATALEFSLFLIERLTNAETRDAVSRSLAG